MRRGTTLLALMLVSLAAPSRAQESRLSAPSGEISPDSLRRIGETWLQATVQKYGRETDPELRRDIGLILTRLRGVSGFQGPTIKWEIVRDSAMNAASNAGAVIVISAGLPTYCRDFTRMAIDARSIRQRYEGCLAAVLSHELAHITLGHTDSVVATTIRRKAIDERMDSVSSVTEALHDKALAGGLAFERKEEFDADRVGALYLLRGGWQVQDMMDMLRALDSLERRSSGSSRILDDLTWFRTHPRGAERESRLETVRATLKLAQRDFDDALTLVNNGVMLDSALVMLDRVLAVFPDLLAARHARAAALHQQWLNVTPVRTKQLRGSVATYAKWFIPSIRGGDATLLTTARRAYQSILVKEEHPYTMSNLAVLDAYAGDLEGAQRRSDRSAQMSPGDPWVLNNHGVVLFLAGRHVDASRAFETAMGAVSDSIADFAAPALAFNFGKTLAILKDPRAARILNLYLEFDDDERSEWRREAIALRGSGGGSVAGPVGRPSAPPRPTAPPSIAGLKLGDSPTTVVRVLGQPTDRREVEVGVVWRYESRGIVVGIDPKTGVALIVLISPSAGSIDGVRVGDPATAARAKWGNPSDVEEGTLTFDRGNWVLHILVEGGVITSIGVVAA